MAEFLVTTRLSPNLLGVSARLPWTRNHDLLNLAKG